MERLPVKGAGFRSFHDFAQVHDRNTVADVLDHAEGVRDEEIGEAKLVLKVFEQVDDLRLNRYVRSGNGFIATG